jgi:hypothetical protein
VKSEDIYSGADKKYNPENYWNSRSSQALSNTDTQGCIVHMIRKNNTLYEAADLVADSTKLWLDNGVVMTDGQAILKKMEVSEESPGRNSDPTASCPSITLI